MRPAYVGVRAGYVVLEVDGQLVAESVDRPWEGRWPVAPVVEVGQSELVVECPTCPSALRSGRPRTHFHSRGTGLDLGEGHRVGHGTGCSTGGYVVLLLDPDCVRVVGSK